MKVKMLHAAPAWLAIRAIRKCYDSVSDGDSIRGTMNSTCIGDNDRRLINLVLDGEHTSTLEHVNYTFEIDGISRALLQEHARHRIASLSVQSTRYTLKKFLKGEIVIDDILYLTGDKIIDKHNSDNLLTLIHIMRNNPEIKNDVLKYGITEAFRSSLIWTINIRSLRNFLKLRSSNRALPEIRVLAQRIYNILAETEHEIFFNDLLIAQE